MPDDVAGRVTVVGLGPGRPGLATAEVLQAIAAVPVRWLRTSRHPSASLVPDAQSFDYLYDSSGRLDEVYTGIVDALVESAAASGHILYAVPGSPAVGERAVELLRADERVETIVLPGVSFVDLALGRLGADPLTASVRIVDGHQFALEAAGHRGPFLVAQCDSALVLSEVKLTIGQALDHAGPSARPFSVSVLHRLGLEDEQVLEVAWEDLDRSVAPDHLTSLWVPGTGLSFAPEVTRLEQLARALRARCPWDRQQTHQSLTRYLVEEAYEAVEAIEDLSSDGQGYEHLEEELGDVLFQVVFHSVLAAEEGQFTLADVARAVHDKLVGRHPHVFGDVEARTPDDVARNWEEIKKREKGRPSAKDDVPRGLPALLYAHKVQAKAASSGFDWPSPAGAVGKVYEELSELIAAAGGPRVAAPPDEPGRARVHEETGDLLFAVVNVARHLRVDPEAALREATAKFYRRHHAVQALAAARGLEPSRMSLADLDRLWDEVKAHEAGDDRRAPAW